MLAYHLADNFFTAVTNAAMLMGCNLEELMVVLSTRKLQAGADCIAKKLTLRQVTFNGVISLDIYFHIVFDHKMIFYEFLCRFICRQPT